uniref:Putative secreted protein n=1 Tax=Anopheles darlingi TaxID=43151 RepID=A0A2M4D9L4_ANODA
MVHVALLLRASIFVTPAPVLMLLVTFACDHRSIRALLIFGALFFKGRETPKVHGKMRFRQINVRTTRSLLRPPRQNNHDSHSQKPHTRHDLPTLVNCSWISERSLEMGFAIEKPPPHLKGCSVDDAAWMS